MGKFINKSKGYKGTIRIRVLSKERGKVIGVDHIGVAHNEEELKMYMSLAQEKLRDKRQQEFRFKEYEQDGVAGIKHKKSYSKFLYETLGGIYDKIGICEVRDEIFKQITLARIIRPASKLETVEILRGLGLDYPLKDVIYRCLRRTIMEGYREKISQEFIRFRGVKKATILMYDVTTLYFEIDKEDEYRKSGMSKERRLEPQITLGLLVDEQGFPLVINSFEGNKAETKTMLPVLRELRESCKVEELTVVADASMLSGENLDLIEAEGFRFIIGSRLHKTPYEIEEYRLKKGEKLKDGQIFETKKKFENKASGKKTIRRVIYQYRQKRAKLDLLNMKKQIEKAQKQLENNEYIKRSKYLKITKAKKEINQELIEETRRKAGIKGYVTNIAKTRKAKIIIKAYHNLFRVEKSFRITKSDLQARPIFHQTREAIEAHLTVCFAALGICRYIEDKTDISIKRFIKTLEVLRTAVIEIAGKEHIAEPAIDIQTQNLIKLLK